jgi:hypothetical protein
MVTKLIVILALVMSVTARPAHANSSAAAHEEPTTRCHKCS